jgi:hypothetical protein
MPCGRPSAGTNGREAKHLPMRAMLLLWGVTIVGGLAYFIVIGATGH